MRGAALIVFGGIAVLAGFWVAGAVSGCLGTILIAWRSTQIIAGDRGHENRVRRLLQLRARLQAPRPAPAHLEDAESNLRSEIDAVVAEDLIAYRKRLTANLFGYVLGALVGVGFTLAGPLWYWGGGTLLVCFCVVAIGFNIRKAVVGPREREARVRRFLQTRLTGSSE